MRTGLRCACPAYRKLTTPWRLDATGLEPREHALPAVHRRLTVAGAVVGEEDPRRAVIDDDLRSSCARLARRASLHRVERDAGIGAPIQPEHEYAKAGRHLDRIARVQLVGLAYQAVPALTLGLCAAFDVDTRLLLPSAESSLIPSSTGPQHWWTDGLSLHHFDCGRSRPRDSELAAPAECRLACRSLVPSRW